MIFTYYPGCTLSTTAKQLADCARLSAEALGFTLMEIDDWQCCGAVFPLGADEIAPKLAAVRALAKAREADRPLVTLCAACHHVLKQVNHQAQADADFRAAIRQYDSNLSYAGETTVLHFMEALRQYIGFDTLRKKITNPLKGCKIGAYYGCLLLRPAAVLQFDDAENPRIFEDFIRAMGAEAIAFPMRNECCGGYRSLQDKGKTQKLTERVISSAAAHGADTLITACPLCRYQLKQYAPERIDILYFTELLAHALGIGDGHA